MDPVTAIILAVTTAVSAGTQYQANKKQEEIAEKAAGIENAKSEMRSRRARNRLISQARRARAQAVVSGQATNTSGGSSQLGAMGSTATNASSAIGAERAAFGANTSLARLQGKSASVQNRLGLQQSLLGGIQQTFGNDDFNKAIGLV